MQLVFPLLLEMQERQTEGEREREREIEEFQSCFSAQEKLANEWIHDLPGRAFNMIQNHRVPAGTALIGLSSDVSTPSCKDLHPFIFP